MWALLRGVALAIGVAAGAVAALSTSAPTPSDLTPKSVAPWTPTVTPSLRDDPRVRAFVQAYAPLIDSVTYADDDVVFELGSRPIHFSDGRMLAEDHLDREGECDPIFYRYPLGPLTEPPPGPVEMPTYCSDVLESLWGDTETEIREHGRSVVFLDHRMYVNEILLQPLAAVEGDLREAARHDPSVEAWIEGIDITYSFTYRDIAGSETRSQHSWGLAVDFVPRSYGGRAVYWRWSRALDREGWASIPIAQRWSPPQPVIDAFEAHGFIWGGKWPHFDAIHFEYRPEILLYNRLAEE